MPEFKVEKASYWSICGCKRAGNTDFFSQNGFFGLSFVLYTLISTPSINRRETSINEMAAHIASVPEAISRSLKILKCQGLISTTRTTITVLEPHELARLAQTEAKDLFVYGRKN